MITEYDFLRDHHTIELSKQLNIPLRAFRVLHESVRLTRDIIKPHYSDLKSLSDDDWKKLLKLEEEAQWPILKELGSSTSIIYKNIDPKKKEEAEKFRKSINHEIELRDKRQSLDERDYINNLKILIEHRFEFLLMIFEINKKTNWWLVAVVAVAGGYAAKKTYDYVKKDKKDKKK